jgi:hypothetical protein
MAKSTTNHGGTPLVNGEPHKQPAVRRLARACIALVRWQRAASLAATTNSTDSTDRASTEDHHD